MTQGYAPADSACGGGRRRFCRSHDRLLMALRAGTVSRSSSTARRLTNLLCSPVHDAASSPRLPGASKGDLIGRRT